MQLSITAAKTIKPNEDPQIQVNTENNAFVFLSAIDQNSDLISRNNEISRADIYSELTYYINMKYPNSTRYHFDNLNAFILEPLVNGYSCGSGRKDLSLVNTMNAKGIDRQYFPEVLFEKKVDSSEFQKFPSIPKSWRLFGVSVHPEKGFTVAKEQPIISVRSDFAVHIEAPSLIKVNDLLKIKITASNFLDTKIDGEVTVEITSGSFMQNIFAETPKIKTEKISVESKKISSLEFTISSEKIKPIKIKATFKVGSDEYSTEKLIKVIPNKIKTTLESFLLEKPVTKDLSITEDSTIVVYGNLLGPALNGLEAIL